ncbi:hypothetical protein DSM107010_69600 [Chroococcidiopsis cubana SAG 39.79]|uniref:Uncharacterized protein n=1 Tax=Chroococcidiopsis cubana SAG 39.79 TaxID=388085 RepID=A0AB37U8Z9_9CYAN|nr:hypothetical protein C7B79_02210 [Chroococcidiopsis cubana CCALA 043]RUS98059.1 hypothetical protein DSM107010_69600 [Chroococcidiopsis cubana SAG 39.79]
MIADRHLRLSESRLLASLVFYNIRVQGNQKLGMMNVTDMHRKYNDNTNKGNLESLWGSSWNKLTPKQRQMVSEILDSNRKKESLGEV